MVNPVVKIENASLTYNQGKPTEFKALQDINLEIYPEEFVIFFGPSGSGKSSLLYLIAGLEIPTTGKVSVGDKADITHLSAQEMIEFHRSSVGMVFQAFYLIPSLSAKDNIMLPMVFADVDPVKREEVTSGLLDRFGIKDFQNRTPSRLSGGQQQRVAIARSLVNNPFLVLADEPVGNLDSKNAEIVLDLIADLKNKDKKTVILVTHDPLNLHKADRVFYIKDGRIVKVAVQNADKHHGYEAFTKPAAPAEGITEEKKETLIDKLAKMYPNLDRNRLLAKLLVNDSLVPYDIEILEQTEIIISKYINKEIDEHEMYKLLDNSTKEGGVSLYEPTAHKLLKSVMEITKEIKVIETPVPETPESTLNQHKLTAKANMIAEFILKRTRIKLSDTRKTKFSEAILNRLNNKYTSEEFRAILDLSLTEGGVGLNSRTAEHFAEKIEILLLRGGSNESN